MNTEGSFICSCPKGYVLNPDGVSCRDLDECATGQHHCEHECINTPGSYKCACPNGYSQVNDKCIGTLFKFYGFSIWIIEDVKLFHNASLSLSADVNECLVQPGNCVAPAQCINTLGSFKCMCPRGFQLDPTGTQCLDTDECIDDGRCQTGCVVNETLLSALVQLWNMQKRKKKKEKPKNK